MSRPRRTALRCNGFTISPSPSLALQESPVPTCIIPPLLLPFSSPNLCPLLQPSTPHQSLSSLRYSPEAFYKRKGRGRHLTLHFCKGLRKFNPLQTLTRRPLRPEQPTSSHTICSQNNLSLSFDSSPLQHRELSLHSFVRFTTPKAGQKETNTKHTTSEVPGSFYHQHPATATRNKRPSRATEDNPLGDAQIPIRLP